mmetsp:Transcript_2817/g.8652  ORF Transcript_2817/g.8652 Transcript_2817/m.8652 type:complete len:242 (+) Transcript_2817:300-1025(+)
MRESPPVRTIDASLPFSRKILYSTSLPHLLKACFKASCMPPCGMINSSTMAAKPPRVSFTCRTIPLDAKISGWNSASGARMRSALTFNLRASMPDNFLISYCGSTAKTSFFAFSNNASHADTFSAPGSFISPSMALSAPRAICEYMDQSSSPSPNPLPLPFSFSSASTSSNVSLLPACIAINLARFLAAVVCRRTPFLPPPPRSRSSFASSSVTPRTSKLLAYRASFKFFSAISNAFNKPS